MFFSQLRWSRGPQAKADKVAGIFRTIASVVLKWLVVPLGTTLIGIMAIGRVANWFVGPASYKIYIVGDMDRSRVARQVADTLASTRLGTIDGIPVEVVERSDHGIPQQARDVSEKIARQPDTLMVVGHMSSGQTEQALPAYLKADPPIPVILTTETNPELVPVKIKQEVYRPVLRLSPTDKEQVETLTRLIVASKARGIWVVQDVSENLIYSEYLATHLIRRLQEKGANVELLSTNLNAPTHKALRVAGIDLVFFAGRWQHALILIRELRAIYGGRMPQIVLSDASADERLIQFGGRDVEGIYLTYPLTVEQSESRHAYGDYTFSIVDSLLKTANTGEFDEMAVQRAGLTSGVIYRLDHLLGLKRVRDARWLIGAVIMDAEESHRPFNTPEDISLRFWEDLDGEDGIRVDDNAKFHVWQIRGGKFVNISVQERCLSLVPEASTSSKVRNSVFGSVPLHR
jgi:Periplasmic binding protein